MKKHIRTLLCTVATGLLVTGAAYAITPTYNIGGNWIADATRPMQCFRTGTAVECIMMNTGFAHKLVGAYDDPTHVKVDVMRRNRGNGCVTHLAATLTLISNDAFVLDWVAQDSNCDLQKGQSGTDPTYTRIF